MQEITLKLTIDTLNLILQALNDSVALRQQNTSILMSNLQSQANSQLQPVTQIVPQA